MRRFEAPVMLIPSDQDIREENDLGLPTKFYWQKVRRFLKGEWPQPWPKATMLGERDLGTDRWFSRALKGDFLVFDVETVEVEKKVWSGDIFQVGLCVPGAGPAIWDVAKYPRLKSKFVQFFRQAVSTMTTVAHNCLFDTARIYENFGIHIDEYKDLQDTMWQHHVLYAEERHDLGYCASVTSPHPKAKHLGVGSYDYLVGDVVDCSVMFQVFTAAIRKDPGLSYTYYEEMLPLARHIWDYHLRGFKVDQDFVVECLEWIPSQIEKAELMAEAYCGFPISLGSPKQKNLIFLAVEDVFAAAKKEGVTIRRITTDAGAISMNKETVTGLRGAFCHIDPDEFLTFEVALARCEDGAHPLLEAVSLYNSTKILFSNYIKPLLVPVDGPDSDPGFLHVGGGAPKPIYGIERLKLEGKLRLSTN